MPYIIAIPPNEVIVPNILMVYLGTGAMIELESMDALRTLLVDNNGWTMLTAVNLMLFALLHNPCSTAVITIYKETNSRKWATVGALLPLGIGFVVTILTASIARLAGWV